MARQEEAQPQANVISARVKDLAGQRFGRLVVQEFAGINVRKKAEWVCLCDCGRTKVVIGDSLTYGNTTSCGCSRSRKVTEKPRIDKPTEAIAQDTEQGYAWRTDKPAAPASGRRLELHPSRLWKYPGNSRNILVPADSLPHDYIPNYKRLHKSKK
jgi:hypothetical protein